MIIRHSVTTAVLPALLGGLTLLGSAVLSGCGPADARGLVPVAGRITLAGGSWPNPGTLAFVPADEQSAASAGKTMPPVRMGFAEFDAEGRFVAQSRRPGDGLMPGRYRVGVSCWKKPPDVASPGEGPAAPEAVRDPRTSPLVVEVPPTGVRNLVIDVSK